MRNALLLCFVSTILAEVEPVYDELHDLITDTHLNYLSYDSARKEWLYPQVDRHPDWNLRGIYTNITFESPTEYNCEHSVPQSWFEEGSILMLNVTCEGNPMKGDLHHLFTAQVQCNSFRSNYGYGIGTSVAKERTGCGKTFSSSPTLFAPDYNKGAVARATLYFLVRYPGFISSVSEFPDESLQEIINWANENPPSIWEYHRNANIYLAQGNRNPFIDFPDWVNEVDFTLGYAHE